MITADLVIRSGTVVCPDSVIEASVAKIAHARDMLTAAESPALLEIDGGVSDATIQRCRAAGADTFVAGNAVFAAPDPAAAIARLRELASG